MLRTTVEEISQNARMGGKLISENSIRAILTSAELPSMASILGVYSPPDVVVDLIEYYPELSIEAARDEKDVKVEVVLEPPRKVTAGAVPLAIDYDLLLSLLNSIKGRDSRFVPKSHKDKNRAVWDAKLQYGYVVNFLMSRAKTDKETVNNLFKKATNPARFKVFDSAKKAAMIAVKAPD